MAWNLEERTLSTLLLPLHQLLKTLDHLIILAHHYPPSSASRVNNYLVSPLPTLWWIILSTHWFPGSSSPARFTAL
ncbi:hypothetical protein ATANTOWER_009369 [Ataeniobius toweri]|uniref:Uncharacterized protein n=1 Tax=Ataeniobius toweri TaxID=208326 RepID=A0ABU7AQH2_9TELE|nr:hypothetical protein [Ataeniobius toweri]